MNEKELEKVCAWLIKNVFRNIKIMGNEECRGYSNSWNSDIDLPAIIASLYNMLHKEVTGEEYKYFFHWANKVGADVEDDYLEEVINELIK